MEAVSVDNRAGASRGPLGQAMDGLKLVHSVRARERQLLGMRGPVFPKKPVWWSLWATLFRNPRVLQFPVGVSNLAAWYVDVLARAAEGSSLFVVAGEMSFALYRGRATGNGDRSAPLGAAGSGTGGAGEHYSSDTMEAFRDALVAGKNINLIAGPQLAVRAAAPERGNPVTELLRYTGTEGTGRFRMFLVPFGIDRPSHFAICGHSVFVEEPHKPTDLPQQIRGKALEDSVLWLNHLVARYQDLLGNQEVTEITIDNLHVLEDADRRIPLEIAG